MDEYELLSLLKNKLSVSLEVIHIDDYGRGGVPYSDVRLKVTLSYNGETIDYDTISLSRLKIEE
jgi:hypothetical protein